VLSFTASPVYCFDFGSSDVKSAPARKAPEIPARIERTPGISSAVAVDAVFSFGAVPPAGGAFAVCSGAAGVAAPDVPAGGLFGGEPVLPGVAPGVGPGFAPGVVDALGGALVAGAGGGVLPDGLDEDPEAPEDEAPDTLGSALRMIGSPSLPDPMTTILAFGDCAKSSVASMPRQRK
jgi:hypothetical protein